MNEARAWLGLGSNLGDRAALIGEAIARLNRAPGLRVVARSGLYRTPPWGEADQPDFLNAAVEVVTALPPHDLLGACQEVERALGRVRTRRWGPRTIDLDILHMEGVALASGPLVLPHPHWRDRAFVLVPLAEIAPDLVIAGIRVGDALAATERAGIARVEDGGPPA